MNGGHRIIAAAFAAFVALGSAAQDPKRAPQGQALQGPGASREAGYNRVGFRNRTASPVWVAIWRGAIVERSGCLAPDESVEYQLPAAMMGVSVRASLTSRADCRTPPVACEAQSQVRPGSWQFEVAGTAQRCAMEERPLHAQPPSNLAAGRMDVYNATRNPVWMTRYALDSRNARRIVDRGCIQPGEHRVLNVLPPGPDQVATFLRAELTRGANCQQPVQCDTTMDASPGPAAGRTVVIEASPSNCSIRWGTP